MKGKKHTKFFYTEQLIDDFLATQRMYKQNKKTVQDLLGLDNKRLKIFLKAYETNHNEALRQIFEPTTTTDPNYRD